MNRTLKYVGVTALLFWALYGVLVFVLNIVRPVSNTPWLAFVPAFFTVLAALTYHPVVLNPNVKIPVMLAVKTGKLLVTLFIVLLYLLLIKVETITFLLTFGGYFLLHLAVETFIMVQVNKQNKKQNEV